MKSFFLFVLFVFSFSTVLAQKFFSGEVHYKSIYKAKRAGFNIDSAKLADRSETMSYLVTDGYYKTSSFLAGAFQYAYTYLPDKKRMYDEDIDNQFITYRDATKGNTDLIRSRIYKDSIKMIAGQKCFMVERVYNGYIQYSYYAMNLKLNHDTFKGHAVGGWYDAMKEVDGALSMGSVTEYTTHVEIAEVVRVVQRKVDPKEFALPDKPIVASMEALDVKVALQTPSQDAIQCYQQKMEAVFEKTDAEGFVSYVGFIVKTDGTRTNFVPYEKDPRGLYQTAIEVIRDCGFIFTPGSMGGTVVDSFVYFPVEFHR